jgi:hypothetical protein
VRALRSASPPPLRGEQATRQRGLLKLLRNTGSQLWQSGKQHVLDAAPLAYPRMWYCVAARRTCVTCAQRACGAARGLGGRRRGHGCQSQVHFPTCCLRRFEPSRSATHTPSRERRTLGTVNNALLVKPRPCEGARGEAPYTKAHRGQIPTASAVSTSPRSHFAPGSRICDTHM